MRFLISGLGSIGRRHLRNLVALGQRDIVLHRTGRSTLPEDGLEGFAVEADLMHALRAYRPDAIVVANPTAYHLDIAIPAARAGCSILLEKPISHSVERVDELRHALVEGGGQLLVGFQFRFHPGLQLIERLLHEGEIGQPVAARAHWGEYLPGWHPWEDYRQSYSARPELGGGVLLTLCHPFDYLRWFFGEVESITAICRTSGELDLDVEDTAEVLLEMQRDMLGSVHLDYLQRPARHDLEIIGTEGTLAWDNQSGSVRQWTTTGEAWDTHPAPEGFERNDLFMEEMRHFLAVIRGESAPVCTLEDGIAVLNIILAAKESARISAATIPLRD